MLNSLPKKNQNHKRRGCGLNLSEQEQWKNTQILPFSYHPKPVEEKQANYERVTAHDR